MLSNGTLVSLGRWCANILPPVTRSRGNRLIVKFRSDASTNGNGFSANWVSSEYDYIKDMIHVYDSTNFLIVQRKFFIPGKSTQCCCTAHDILVKKVRALKRFIVRIAFCFLFSLIKFW